MRPPLSDNSGPRGTLSLGGGQKGMPPRAETGVAYVTNGWEIGPSHGLK